MRCIFCLDEKPGLLFTDEHVFPKAIGGRFVIRNVCKRCNDLLGSRVDCRLTEHVVVQAARGALDLAGKGGRVPKLLEHMALAGKPGHRLVNRLDAHGKPQHYLVPHVERRTNADGCESVSIVVDVSDRDRLPEMLNKMRSRAGLSILPSDEIQSRAQVVCTPHPVMEKHFTVDEHEYKRCILKIAYELTCHWLGEGYLDDPHAELMRRCVVSEEAPDEEMTRLFFDRIDYHEDGGLGRFWDFEEDSHLGMLTPLWTEAGIAAYVRIFKIFEGTLLVSRCSVAERYPSIEGMFVGNPVCGGEVRELTLRREISRNRRNPSP